MICEQDVVNARLVFGALVYSWTFRRLSLLPQLLTPVNQVINDDIYLHQNPKHVLPRRPLGLAPELQRLEQVGDTLRPDCIMASVFVDDFSVSRSRLLIIPRSHHHGLIDEIKDTPGLEGLFVIRDRP